MDGLKQKKPPKKQPCCKLFLYFYVMIVRSQTEHPTHPIYDFLSIHPSIHSPHCLTYWLVGNRESIPGDSEHRAKGQSGQDASLSQGTITHTVHSHTLSCNTDNLEMAVSQQCMSLDWWRKLENPEKPPRHRENMDEVTVLELNL